MGEDVVLADAGMLVQPEMERGRSPLVSIPPFGRGFSRVSTRGHRWAQAALNTAASLRPGGSRWRRVSAGAGPVYDKAVSRPVISFRRGSPLRPTGVRRAAGVRAAGPERLLFFMQCHPSEETSIGPGKRSLDLLPVD